MPSPRLPRVQPPPLPLLCPFLFGPALNQPWCPLFSMLNWGSRWAYILSVPTLDPWVVAKIIPPPMRNSFLLCNIYLSFEAGVPNLWDLMPDDLRWSWCQNYRNIVHNKCNALEKWSENESRSAVSNYLRPHGLNRPWNSPGKTTGVGCPSLLQGIFPIQGSNPGPRIAAGFFTNWATMKAQMHLNHPQTMPLSHNPQHWDKLSWNQSLMPKMLGTTALRYTFFSTFSSNEDSQ